MGKVVSGFLDVIISFTFYWPTNFLTPLTTTCTSHGGIVDLAYRIDVGNLMAKYILRVVPQRPTLE